MRKPKPLTREKYLAKFSRSARWRLGAAEAEEAIADYREMVFQEERDEGKLVEELGDPVQAAWLLTDARDYKRWLAMFAVLAFGLFLCACWAWTGLTLTWFSWDWSIPKGWRTVAVMAAGIPLSLFWFRRHGQKSGPLSRRLLLALAAVLMFGLVMVGLTWHQFDPNFLATFAEMDYETLAKSSAYREIVLYRELIINGGTVCALIALAGLVLARCYDRRWLALYTLALTVSALCIIVEFVLLSIDLSYIDQTDPDAVRTYIFTWLIPTAVAGLAGTGVALC